ncbi:MAG TPA: ferritin family protein [Candidatus Cloacimonadota bacterium]|nr:ferritin family protein [Candidatus Cloacimonadota bacterium]HPT70726.1 ferritin family protein [Candidatus Cloacimonadota bacterium]
MQQYSLNEIVELAVQIEKNGYAFYDEAIRRKDLDERAVTLLTELRNQESNHEKIFLHLRDDKDLMMLGLSQDWEEVGYYMKAVVGSRLFNSADSAIKLAAEAKNFLEILRFAISFEKDTLLFFYSIYDNITDEKSRKVIRQIINEEISHVVRLTEFHSQG